MTTINQTLASAVTRYCSALATELKDSGSTWAAVVAIFEGCANQTDYANREKTMRDQVADTFKVGNEVKGIGRVTKDDRAAAQNRTRVYLARIRADQGYEATTAAKGKGTGRKGKNAKGKGKAKDESPTHTFSVAIDKMTPDQACNVVLPLLLLTIEREHDMAKRAILQRRVVEAVSAIKTK